MSAASVIQILENRHLGRNYVWQAAGGGQVHHWLTAGNRGLTPNYAGGGMCCFHLPIMAAYLSGDLSWNDAGNLIVAQMTAGLTNTFPAEWGPDGSNRYYFGSFCCIPIRGMQETIGQATPIRRGDIVYFSARNLPYFAHVAVATGNGTETISFGHGAGLQGGAALPVERRTIHELLDDFNNQMTEVRYGAPPW